MDAQNKKEEKNTGVENLRAEEREWRGCSVLLRQLKCLAGSYITCSLRARGKTAMYRTFLFRACLYLSSIYMRRIYIYHIIRRSFNFFFFCFFKSIFNLYSHCPINYCLAIWSICIVSIYILYTYIARKTTIKARRKRKRDWNCSSIHPRARSRSPRSYSIYEDVKWRCRSYFENLASPSQSSWT